MVTGESYKKSTESIGCFVQIANGYNMGWRNDSLSDGLGRGCQIIFNPEMPGGRSSLNLYV